MYSDYLKAEGYVPEVDSDGEGLWLLRQKYWNDNEMNCQTRIDQDMILNAWNYAAAAHEGQRVPGTGYPYINHVGAVAMEAMGALIGNPTIENPGLLLVCAILHDILEDTEGTYQDIKHRFGRSVADGVAALTKNNALPDKVEQMRDSLERILEQPKEIWMVKLCDRITNLQPPPADWSPEKIAAYREEGLMILESLGAADARLERRLRMKIDRYGAGL